MSAPARVAGGLAWFGALAVLYGIAVGPSEGGGDNTAGTPFILGLLVASLVAGALFGLPALCGPPAGLLVLLALSSAGIELPLFVSSALWAVGAFFLAALQLLAAGLGITGRELFLHRRRRRDAADNPAYNPAP